MKVIDLQTNQKLTRISDGRIACYLYMLAYKEHFRQEPDEAYLVEKLIFSKTMNTHKRDNFEHLNNFVLNEYLRSIVTLCYTGKNFDYIGNRILLNQISNYFELKHKLNNSNNNNNNNKYNTNNYDRLNESLLSIKKESIFRL